MGRSRRHPHRRPRPLPSSVVERQGGAGCCAVMCADGISEMVMEPSLLTSTLGLLLFLLICGGSSEGTNEVQVQVQTH